MPIGERNYDICPLEREIMTFIVAKYIVFSKIYRFCFETSMENFQKTYF